MSPTLPIVFCGPGNPGKVAPHQFMAAFWLASKGFDVKCICHGDYAPGVLQSPIAAVPVLQATGPGMLSHLRLILALWRARLKFRDATFFMEGSPVAPAAVPGLAGVPRSRIIYQTQDYLDPGRYPWRARWECMLARMAHLVVSNEPQRAARIASNCGLPKTPMVIRTALPAAWPAPAPDEKLRRELTAGGGDNAKLIFAGGAFSPVRCSAALLDAMRLLPPHYRLIFSGMPDTGSGAMEVQKEVVRRGLAGRVHILGLLPFDRLMQAMTSCDIGILLYPDDGFGNYHQAPGRFTEYLLAGLPFVTSNFPSLKAPTEQYNLGATCDPTDYRAIASAIKTLGLRADDRATERERLRNLARTVFAYERQADQLARALGLQSHC